MPETPEHPDTLNTGLCLLLVLVLRLRHGRETRDAWGENLGKTTTLQNVFTFLFIDRLAR